MDVDANIILRINQLNAYYGKQQVLKDVTYTLTKNKITALVGQSGCGKSTLLKSINQIISEEGGHTTGEVQLSGHEDGELSLTVLRQKIGLVFQKPIVFPFSIEKNVAYALRYHEDLSKQQLAAKVRHYLEEVALYDEVKGKLKEPASQLSGGQQQKLAIARSLSVEPVLLMLDEPCSALDIKSVKAIEELLIKLKEKYSLLIVTHNLSQAKRIADQIIFMDNGKIIEENRTSDFFAAPKHTLTKEFMTYLVE